MNPKKKEYWSEAIEPIFEFNDCDLYGKIQYYNYKINPDYLFEKIYKELELITGFPCRDKLKDVSNSGGYQVNKMDLTENLENILRILSKYRKELTVLEEELPPDIGDKK